MAALGVRCFDCVRAMCAGDDDAAAVLASLCASLRGADGNSRLEAVLSFTQLGGIEQVLSLLHPPRPVSAHVAWTLLGLIFSDANVLTNRLGKTVFSNSHFLPALLASGPAAPLPMLSAQVLNNLLKSASKQSMLQIAESRDLMGSMLVVLDQAAASPLDWRHVYIVLHSTMLLCIGGAHSTLESLGLVERVCAWLGSSQPSAAQAAAQRTALSILFLWGLHHVSQFAATAEGECPPEVAKAREVVSGLLQAKMPLFAAAASAAASDGPPCALLCEATMSVLACERTEGVAQVFQHLSAKVKDWTVVGDQAQQRVRSEQFKKDFEQEQQQQQQQQGQQQKKKKEDSDSSDAD